jgi:hypothetical protein
VNEKRRTQFFNGAHMSHYLKVAAIAIIAVAVAKRLPVLNTLV